MKHVRRLGYVHVVSGTTTAVLGLALLSGIPQATAADPQGLGHGVSIDRHDETGTVGFVGTRPGRPIDAGLPNCMPAAHGGDVVPGSAREGTRPDSEPTALRSRAARDPPRDRRARRPAYKGVPVLGGEFVVNLDENKDMLSVLGEASPIVDACTEPAVCAAEAAMTAVTSVARSHPDSDCVLEGLSPAADVLRRQVAQRARAPFRSLGSPGSRRSAAPARRSDIGERVIVDAASGTVALSFATIAHAKNRVVCDANNVAAADYPCAAPDRTEASPPVPADDDDMELAFALRRRHLRLLLQPVRPGQPRRRWHAVGVDHRLLPRRAQLPVRERLLGRLADGVRRRLRQRRRRGRPRAHPWRDRLQLQPLLLPAVRRHQRVDVRRLR